MFYCMNQRRRLFTFSAARADCVLSGYPVQNPHRRHRDDQRRIARAHQRQRQPRGRDRPADNQCVYHRLDSIDERNPRS